MKLKIPFLLVLTSFLLHFYLMNTHYAFRYGVEGQKSLCSINETLNCESVSISPYSYFAGLPLATWGMAFHLAFLFLFALVFVQPADNKNTRRNSLLRFIKSFSLLSLIGSLVMGVISVTLMKTYCIFCISLYVLSIINFLLLAIQKDVSFLPNAQDIKSLFKSGEAGLTAVLITLVTIPVVAYLAHDMETRDFKKKNSYMIAEVIAEWEKAPEFTFTSPLVREGSTTPKFTIVEFADFECVHCKNAAHNLHSFVSAKSDIELQFYSFPLDASCNPALGAGTGSGKRCVLAKAVYCSEKQGKGWKAHTWIFDRFGSDENSQFEKMSKDLGLDHSALNACIASEDASQFILAQVTLGKAAKVEGTPAVYVNGKRLNGGHIIAVLETLYAKLHP